MSFQQGLSGLSAASQTLEAIGHNVANANTVGFKQSQVQFADVYAGTLTGSSANQVGIGTQVARIAQLFSQGNISQSDNPLDMAISGNGFFRMSTNGAITYTRNGQFSLSKEGYIENAAGARLTGYLADSNGVIAVGAPSELVISKTDLAPSATSEYDLKLTLDSRKDALDATAFDPDDTTTYSDSTSTSVYDSLGNTHILRTFYVKTDAGEWSVFATNDGVPIGYTAGDTPVAVGTLSFGTGGALTTTPTTMTVEMAVTTGAATPYTITIDHAGTQQFAQDFTVSSQLADGYAAGTLVDFSVSNNGEIVGRYSNGQTSLLGQVILTNFANPNGLQNIGNNQWVETSESGVPLIGTPGSGVLGAVQSSRIEESNVDLTEELVNMITAQRYYQANAQTIKTQDQILQTLVNLR